MPLSIELLLDANRGTTFEAVTPGPTPGPSTAFTPGRRRLLENTTNGTWASNPFSDFETLRKQDGRREARRQTRLRLHAMQHEYRNRQRGLQENAASNNSGQNLDGTNFDDSSCPCLAEFPALRAPTEIEFLDRLNQVYSGQVWKDFDPSQPRFARASEGLGYTLPTDTNVVPNNTVFHDAIDVAENSTLFTCHGNVSQLETLVIIDVDGVPENMSLAEVSLLERGMMLTFNELSFWACDPYDRMVQNVTLKRIFPDLLDGGNNLLVFDVTSSCRNCNESDLLLFTQNIIAMKAGNKTIEHRLPDMLEMPFTPFLTDRDDIDALLVQYRTDDIECFCPANEDYTNNDTIRSPYITEFGTALNETFYKLRETFMLQNVSLVREVIEVETYHCEEPNTTRSALTLNFTGSVASLSRVEKLALSKAVQVRTN